MALQSAPTSIDPSKGSGGANSIFQDPAYQGLFHITGVNTITPSLASAYKWLGTGNKTLQVTLRPGLKFSDGTALDAAAVKTSVEHFKSNGSVFGFVAAPISSIDTPNKTTVVFNLSASTPDFIDNLAEQSGMGMPISPKAIASNAALGTSTDGAGPYVLSTSRTVEGSVYEYTPNAHYYDQSAIKYSKIVLKVIASDATALSALKSGQVDASYGEPDNYKTVKASTLGSVAFPVNADGLWIQDQDGKLVPALADLKVRQAMQYAVNRTAVSQAVTLGSGSPLVQNLLPGTLGFDKSLDSMYPYSVSKAKALLSEAGYASGFSMSVTVAPGPEYSAVAQALASQLGAVGIKVTLVPAATFPEYAKAQESGQYDATVVGLGMLGMPAAMDNVFGPGALVNPRHTVFTDVVAAAAKASALQGAAGESAWEAVNKLTVDEALVLPVTTSPTIAYWGKTVSGVNSSSALDPVFFSPTK